MNRVLDAALGGWQTNTVVSLASGTPIDFNWDGGLIDTRPYLLSFQKVNRTVIATGSNVGNASYFVGQFALPPVNSFGMYTVLEL